jgi:hypothetical protein
MLATNLPRRSADYSTLLPSCPNCGRPMSLARTETRPGAADVCIFKCGECGVWLNESADDRHPV